MIEKSRREQQTEETRRALLLAGRRLFGSKGFADTSAQQIVAQARVTRGALYHHFPRGKQEVFEAVVHDVQAQLLLDMKEAAKSAKDPWRAMFAALEAYFDLAINKPYRQIALQDGPAVLGWRAWRALEQQYSLKFIQRGLEDMMEKGLISRMPSGMLASVIFGACCEATLAIASERDLQRAKTEAIDVMIKLLQGMIV